MLISLLQKIPIIIVGILLIIGALTIYFRSKNVTKTEFVKINSHLIQINSELILTK